MLFLELKIRVSAVQFCPGPPGKSKGHECYPFVASFILYSFRIFGVSLMALSRMSTTLTSYSLFRKPSGFVSALIDRARGTC